MCLIHYFFHDFLKSCNTLVIQQKRFKADFCRPWHYYSAVSLQTTVNKDMMHLVLTGNLTLTLTLLQKLKLLL